MFPMITGFANQGSQDIYDGTNSKDARKVLPTELWAKAAKQMSSIHAASQVGDLRLPPSNNLEKLSGNLDGKWSIRINKQYRVVFRFEGGNASEVEVTDYH